MVIDVTIAAALVYMNICIRLFYGSFESLELSENHLYSGAFSW